MRIFSYCFLSSGLAAQALSAPTTSSDLQTVHEIRERPQVGFGRKPVERDAVLPIRIGLKQNSEAAENAVDWLMTVSKPDSPQYGQHWSQEDIIKAFQPEGESVAAVREWLAANGIHHAIQTDNKQWLAFDLPAAKAETLFDTKYYEYKLKNGRSVVSCDTYSLPHSVATHVDLIKPGIKDSDVTGRTRRSRLHARSVGMEARLNRRSASLGSTNDQPALANATNLDDCFEATTPACIRALYGLPAPDPSVPANPNNTFGLFEEGSLFYQPDLDRFWHDYTNIPVGTAPIVDSIDGGQQPPSKPGAPGWATLKIPEANLDVQLVLPIIYPQTLTVYQTDDPYWANSSIYGDNVGLFNTFLDAIDGSYCTYSAFNETGNSSIDPQYPDTNHTNGWKGQLQCGVYKPTNVIAASYGSQENYLPFNYQKRQCNEWLKLGLQGVTALFASGDNGVGTCGEDGRVYEVGQPDGCPWVTSVGATEIKPGSTVSDVEEAVSNATSSFYSGGGFSMIFERPAYQCEAVEHYFKDSNPPYPYFYNASFQHNDGKYSRNGRGVPDLAAVGSKIAGYNANEYLIANGTSASVQIVGAMINRIVEERLKIGKGPVGFINPTVYGHPEAFHDIVEGSNPDPSCTGQGFSCSKGWDPVTGVGTPNYQALLDVFLNLP